MVKVSRLHRPNLKLIKFNLYEFTEVQLLGIIKTAYTTKANLLHKILQVQQLFFIVIFFFSFLKYQKDKTRLMMAKLQLELKSLSQH